MKQRYMRGAKECRHSYTIYSSILPPIQMRPTRRWMRWHNRCVATDGLPHYRCVRDMKKVDAVIAHLEAAGGKGVVWREVTRRYHDGGTCHYVDRTYNFGGYRDD